MRFLTICLLVLGLASFSLGSDDETNSSEDVEVGSQEEEDRDESVEEEDLEEFVQEEDFVHEEDLPEIPPEDLQEAFLEVLQDVSLLDLEDAPHDFSQDALRGALQEAFRTWNGQVKDCDGDELCLAQVNNELRPIVNQAADAGLLSVIEPCEDRVGTYELETEDGWTIEATLPC